MSTTIRTWLSFALCIQIGDYCKWEKTGISNNDLERIVPLVKDVIKMFKLPLLVRNGDKSKKEDLSQEMPPL